MTAPAVEHLPEWMRRNMQRIRDELTQRREAMLVRVHSEPPPPGTWRDIVTGHERPATERELREADRLLAKHRRWVDTAEREARLKEAG